MVGFPDGPALCQAARARTDPQVEIALQRAFGIDVTDPANDLRRIYNAVTHLPMGYWPDTDHAASWSVTDYLLANLIDAVRELTYVTVKINAGKNANVQKPDPHFRPGVRQRRPTIKTRWADLPRLLGGASKSKPDSQLSNSREQ